MLESWLATAIGEDFEGADFGDERLTARLRLMAAVLEKEPSASFAKASRSVAEREGAYRFLENRRVSKEKILEPHQEATVRRAREVGTIYVVSDTTEFIFEGDARGKSLGRLQGRKRGFRAHAALAVSADAHRAPLGVLGLDIIVRPDEKQTKHRNDRQSDGDADRESARWGRMVEHTESLLEGVKAIHLMDREADMFELLSTLRHGRHFVIRATRDRAVEDGKLFESVSRAEVMLEREVNLSARPKVSKTGKSRGRAARFGRQATLHVSAKSVHLQRPKRCGADFPATIAVNVVQVAEPNPPEGQDAVHWLLLTSEPIETAEQVAAVVDAYRARWTIEEFFKALKTGCAYEDRQLRSIATLTKALAILAPIAWRLLLLRSLERAAPLTPATEILEPIVLEALAAKLKDNREPKPLPNSPTVADAMHAIARLGAHHKSNGPPGWQVLWRGFHDLLMFASGFIAGRSTT